MFTSSPATDSRLILAAAMLFFGMSCNVERQPASGPRTGAVRDAPTISDEPRGLASDRDLLLFGQSSPARDVSSETNSVSDYQRHTTASDGAAFDPNVDPFGRTIVFASTRNARFSHLYTKPADGNTIRQITDVKANDAQPAFSPDGTQIAFCSDRAGQWDIWLIDADGRNPRQITNNPMPELHPSWSPDGRRLVYCRINPQEGRGELWISELDNPGAKRLIGEGLFPSWSPRGDRIAYQRARSPGSRWFSIWTIHLEDNEALYPTEVAHSTDAALIAPSWSPDGSQLTFAWVHAEERALDDDPRHVVPRQADICVVDADGGGLHRLTSGSGENYCPHWGSDGRIYYSSRSTEGEAIWSLRPFRPMHTDEPPTFIRDRQAAQVIESSGQE